MSKRLSKEEWKAQQQEVLEGLHQSISDHVSEVVTGQDWADMLAAAAKFHTYSFNNSMLIALQTGGKATLPASYTTWKQLGRYVKKGEKGIKILAPVLARTYKDKTTGEVLTKEEAKTRPPQSVVVGSRIVNVKVAHVFDVSQTDGEPLPELSPKPILLEGQAPEGLKEALEGIIKDHGFTCAYVDPATLDGANGVTKYGVNAIEVSNDLSPAQTVKTLIHEVAHMQLHDPTKDGQALGLHRDQKEVEAESTAFLVASAHGLDTSEYTFPYVAGWSGGDVELIKSTATTVVSQAQKILEVTQPERDLDIDRMKEIRASAETNLERARQRPEPGVTKTKTFTPVSPQTRDDILAKLKEKFPPVDQYGQVATHTIERSNPRR